MDEGEEPFEEYLGYESEPEDVEEEEFESEEAQIRALETGYESESEDIIPKPDQATVIENLELEIDKLNEQIESGEISFEKYNELLIFNQTKIADEKIKALKLAEHEKISDDLMSELTALFEDLRSKQKKSKFHPTIVGETIDDIFRKYGEALERELTEEREFFFESNPITSDISNILNLPVPEKYQKQMQMFEQKIARNEVSIDDIYAYLDLRFNILNENLEQYLKHDVLYIRFKMELQMEFATLRSELELMVGETSNVLDQEVDEFNKKHGIIIGVLKKRTDILSNINALKTILESKIVALIQKYGTVQDTLFKKQDSKEVLKVFKQLREIYIKNEYSKLSRKFLDEEIIDDFKNKSLNFIIEKYAQYVVSDYFDWAAGKKEEIYEKPKYTKRVKLSDKELENVRRAEIREHKQRREFEKILSTLPKEILLKCADRLIAEGKMSEPYSELTQQERFINELYSRSILIWTFSKYYPEDIQKYAEEVGKMTDEFMINKEMLISGWITGPKVQVGDIVYVDRTNGAIRQTMDEILKIQNQIEKIKSEGHGQHIAKLQHRLIQLELKLKSYNKYMKAPQLKGIATGINDETGMIDVKIDGSSTVRSFPEAFVSIYLKPTQELPLYVVAESDAFNPSAPLKSTNLLPITKWIRILLSLSLDSNPNVKIGLPESKQELSKLYDQAMEIYEGLSEEKQADVRKKVMAGVPSTLSNMFVNGIPSKEILIYAYPPILPEIPDIGEPNYEEFIEYSKQLKDYIENLTPENNPYVKIGTPVTNKLIDRIDEKTYSSLREAVKDTPVNGFFKLSSINDIESLILRFLDDREKRSFQRTLLTDEQIKEFNELFFLSTEDKDRGKFEVAYRPVLNPKITFVNELRTITEPEKYIETVGKIDKEIKITKIVGEEIFIQGRDKPVTKISLERTLLGSLEREYQNRPITTDIGRKRDPLIDSIQWGLRTNPTFQLLDLSKRLRGSFIVHTEPKYRIRLINHSGKFYTGWTINPIKEIIGSERTYHYKFPLIITDFTEFLKLYRNNLVLRYDAFRKMDVLEYEDFISGGYILRHIQWISQYLQNIGEETGFDIEIIQQQDVNLKVRQEQRKALLEALNFMSGGVVETNELQNVANDIEIEIYNSFEDIRKGVTKKGIRPITDTTLIEHFELIKKFRKSKLPTQYITGAIFRSDKRNYGAYIYRISIAVFNIYRTNDFVTKYLKDAISLDDVIYRDLTENEFGEEPATIENLITWSPPTDVLETLRASNPDAYDRIIKNGPNIVDMSVIDNYEHETKRRMGFLYKKLALIELVRLKSWQKTLGSLEQVKDSEKLMFLIKHRNALRSINDITSKDRLDVVHILYDRIYKCKTGIDGDVMEEYAENIEAACYNLSNNRDEYLDILVNILRTEGGGMVRYNKSSKNFEIEINNRWVEWNQEIKVSSKLCKLISEFNRTGAGPVEIITGIAEHFLDFGKTHAAELRKVKIGDWNGIQSLPTELLVGIKKIANSMSESIARKRKGEAMIKTNPQLGIQEFRIVKDINGEFIVKQIDKPFVVDEKKKDMDMLLKIIKMNYVPRVNDTFSAEIQKLIDKGIMISDIVEELHSRENPDQVHIRWSETGRRKATMLRKTADYESLRSMTYEQLLDIQSNFYREPTFYDTVPMLFAKDGVVVYPLKSRRGFLIGGNFPLDVRSYRYRDENGVIRSRLTDICHWVGSSIKTTDLTNLNSIYEQKIVHFEAEMLECVKKLRDSGIWIKIHSQDIVDSKATLSKIITVFDMYKPIEESVIKYFNEFGGNKKLFANGGTKEEYESFLNNTMYTEAMKKLLGIPTLVQKKESYKPNIIVDSRIDVSILRNGGHVIYRKMYKSRLRHTQSQLGMMLTITQYTQENKRVVWQK